MMLVAEVVLLSPILDWLLIIAVGLLALMFLVAPRDITRQQQLPQVDEEPNPLEVAYLRRQSSGVIELVIYDLVEAGRRRPDHHLPCERCGSVAERVTFGRQ